MTTHEAKKLVGGALVAAALRDPAITFGRLTAQTVNSPFGGPRRIFVKVYDWTPHPFAEALQATAKAHGFCVEFAALNGIPMAS